MEIRAGTKIEPLELDMDEPKKSRERTQAEIDRMQRGHLVTKEIKERFAPILLKNMEECNASNEARYDRLLRTLTMECGNLIIPVINEALGTKYDIGASVKLYGSGQAQENIIAIEGDKTHKFQIICLDSSDTGVLIKKMKNVVITALHFYKQGSDRVEISIPLPIILVLRNRGDEDKKFDVELKVPGASRDFSVPMVNVPRYTLEELFAKKLFFLIPITVLRFEEFTRQEREQKLMQIRERLQAAIRNGEISEHDEKALRRMIHRVLNTM